MELTEQKNNNELNFKNLLKINKSNPNTPRKLPDKNGMLTSRVRQPDEPKI